MSQAELIDARVIHGDGNPLLIFGVYTEIAPDVFSLLETEYDLGLVIDRNLKIEPQRVSSQLLKSGRKVDWLQHLWFSGDITIPKLSWRVAKILMKALEFQANSISDGDFSDTLKFKRFASDPYAIPISLTSNFNINKIATNAFIGETITVSFRGTQAWETTGLTMQEYWYADSETDYRTWSET